MIRPALLSVVSAVFLASSTVGPAVRIERPAWIQNSQDSNDCQCPTLKARSTPSDPQDLCSKGETNGTCTLKWNLPLGGSAAFNKALAGVRKAGVKAAPKQLFGCANGTASCQWIEFLKRDESYGEDPETAGVGFLLLVATAFATGPISEQDRANLVLNEAPKAVDLGVVLQKGGSWSAVTDMYSLHGSLGCLQASAQPKPNQKIVIQNSRSRRENTCRN